jgi:hypothetical protein
MIHQEGDILSAIPQGGQGDLDDAHAIQEIFPDRFCPD